MNLYRIKENENKGIYKGKEVLVLERNHIHGFAKIKIDSAEVSQYITLEELHKISTI